MAEAQNPVFSGVVGEVCEQVETTIVNTMGQLFPYIGEYPEKTPGDRDLPMVIHEALAGTRPMRIRKAPAGEALERNLTRIGAMVEADAPISLLMLIGTAKFPDGKPDQNIADLADFGAVQTVMALDQRVRAVYPAGISVRAYYEDFVGDWLFGEQCWPSQEAYLRSLQQLHGDTKAQFGHNPIHLVRESDIMAGLGVGLDDFRSGADEHRERFHEYLLDSDEILADRIAATGYAGWDEARARLGSAYPEFLQETAGEALTALPSFKALEAQGWSGTIPPEMREFYLRRFANNANTIDPSRAGRLAYMARYYGSTLMKAQLRSTAAELSEDAVYGFDPLHALKLALLGLAPGIPSAFQDAYQMRAIPNLPKRGGVDNSTAPWRCVGGVLVRECQERARVNITSSSHFDPEAHVPAKLTLRAGGLIHAPIALRELQPGVPAS